MVVSQIIKDQNYINNLLYPLLGGECNSYLKSKIDQYILYSDKKIRKEVNKSINEEVKKSINTSDRKYEFMCNKRLNTGKCQYQITYYHDFKKIMKMYYYKSLCIFDSSQQRIECVKFIIWKADNDHKKIMCDYFKPENDRPFKHYSIYTYKDESNVDDFIQNKTNSFNIRDYIRAIDIKSFTGRIINKSGIINTPVKFMYECDESASSTINDYQSKCDFELKNWLYRNNYSVPNMKSNVNVNDDLKIHVMQNDTYSSNSASFLINGVYSLLAMGGIVLLA
jgi:hypothetical protein